jgi:AcrR family transcriptional regulator
MKNTKIGRPQVIADDERRALILAAAEHVFDRHGFGETSMQEIAAASGMAKKTVYKFFPDKMAVFGALIASHDILQDQLASDPGEVKDRTERLTQTLQKVATFILSPRQLMLTRLVIAEAHKSPELARRFHQECMTLTRQLLEQTLRAEFLAGHDEDSAARDFADMAVGAAIGVLHLDALMLQIDAPALEAEIARRARLIATTFTRLFETDQDALGSN